VACHPRKQLSLALPLDFATGTDASIRASLARSYCDPGERQLLAGGAEQAGCLSTGVVVRASHVQAE
jgi:hypothetical protein